jgi:hypothetical protein
LLARARRVIGGVACIFFSKKKSANFLNFNRYLPPRPHRVSVDTGQPSKCPLNRPNMSCQGWARNPFFPTTPTVVDVVVMPPAPVVPNVVANLDGVAYLTLIVVSPSIFPIRSAPETLVSVTHLSLSTEPVRSISARRLSCRYAVAPRAGYPLHDQHFRRLPLALHSLPTPARPVVNGDG